LNCKVRDDKGAILHPKGERRDSKNSIAAMASQWLFRKAFHCSAGPGFLEAFRVHLGTVHSEMLQPSIFSSQ
jgi:hypothetical protein